MTLSELKRDDDFLVSRKREGIYFGKLKKKIIGLKETNQFNGNFLTVGSAGSGKTSGFILPFIYSNLSFLKNSLIVVDTKGTLFNKSANLAREKGYVIKVLNLVNKNKSQGFDILKIIGKDKTAIKRLARGLVGDKGGDEYFKNGAISLLTALICLFNYQDDYEKVKLEGSTFNDLLNFIYHTETPDQLLFDKYTKVFSMLESYYPYHPALDSYKTFLASCNNGRDSQKLQGMFLQNLLISLEALNEEESRRILSSDEIDLTRPGIDKCCYYINLNDQDIGANKIANIFFSELFYQLTNFADRSFSQRLPVKVNLVLDEFTNLGKLPNFDKFIATCRSRGIGCVLSFQNLNQLKSLYGDDSETIKANCDVWVITGVMDYQSQKEISNQAGTTTIYSTSESSNGTLKREDQRALITPDELRRLKRDELLVISNSHQPVLLKQYRYYEISNLEVVDEDINNF